MPRMTASALAEPVAQKVHVNAQGNLVVQAEFVNAVRLLVLAVNVRSLQIEHIRE